MMHFEGFRTKWINRVKMMLNSGTSSILLNGIPSKTLHCRRGVRQGDLISPLLLLLKLPLHLQNISHFPILQYDDDTLLIMQAYPRQLLVLKALLNTFAKSTGLKVNYVKSSMMMPINIIGDRLEHLAQTFGCQVGALPFT
jgi:hypothetical protein